MGEKVHATLTLHSGEEDQLIIHGYRRNLCKTILTWLGIVLTVGILRLVFYWMQHWMLFAMNSPCSLEEADHVLVVDLCKQMFVCQVRVLTKDSLMRIGCKSGEVRSSECLTLGYPGKNGELHAVERVRFFDDRKMRYFWNEEEKVFHKILGLDADLDVPYVHSSAPLRYEETLRRTMIFQPNTMDIAITPIVELLFKELLNPFYIFQIFSITLWMYYGYCYYAGAIIVMSVGSLILTVRQIRNMQQMLRDRIHGQELVEVCRPDGQTEIVQSDALVPGDIIIIPTQGCEVMCDAVLIAGSVIVNESALTGESVPVVKNSLPERTGRFDIKADQRHVLFCGTKILQTRYYANEPVKALVLRTGFSTSKGTLIRSIMYPKPVDFKFYTHSYYFIMLLSAVALCGMVYSIILRVSRNQALNDIIIRSLDVITIAVPPALPAALSVGIVFAQRRLKQAKIFCLSPRAINICGSINLVCFDKTGTLTEDGLDLKCVVPCSFAHFEEPVEDPAVLQALPDSTLRQCMAACHSLTIIQGKLSGDPVDLIMFKAAGFTLEEPDISEPSRFDLVAPTVVTSMESPHSQVSESIGIIKDFPFQSSLQRMSTIVRRLGDPGFSYYVKGSPEKLVTLCRPDTVPDDFQDQLEAFTRRGDRVLAVAWKELDGMKFVRIHKLEREDLDNNLLFVGFVVMENRLKGDTNAVLEELHRAEIRLVMVTGDNIDTAISVSRECGMVREWDNVQVVSGTKEGVSWVHSEWAKIPENKLVSRLSIDRFNMESSPSPEGAIVVKLPKRHLALNGESFEAVRTNHPEKLKKVLAEGTVFARMSPVDKEHLVEEFQKVGYYVAMCGDGANDCGALKAAHAGISLSESEAAAAAPFTACTGSISCVPKVIKEGRAALVTSFGIFKYMAGYSLSQFFSVIVLYWIATNLADLQFLYVDIFQVLVLSATLGRSRAHTTLSRTPPPTSLIAFIPIFSVVSQVLVVVGFQLAAFFYAYSNPDETSFASKYNGTTPTTEFASKENFAVFSVGAFQYVWLAVAFAKGPPYRKALWKNRLFCASAAAMIAFDLFLLFGDTKPFNDLLDLEVPDLWDDRLILFGMAAANGVTALFIEKIVVDYLIYHRLGQKFKWIRDSKRHKDVTRDLLRHLKPHQWEALQQKNSATAPRRKMQSISLADSDANSQAYTNRGFVGEPETTL